MFNCCDISSVAMLGIPLLAAAYYLGRSRSKFNAANKVIVITGASSGIGAELARQYASQKAILVLFARRERELNEIAEECRKLGAPKCVTVAGDVSIDGDCRKLMEQSASINGTIDCIILNAGISMGDFFEDVHDMAMIRKLTEVNYHGPVACTMYALPYLKKSRDSKIVVISSLAGKIGTPLRTGYCGSKFALHGFFNALRAELEPKYGTQVTIICPGVVATEINRTRLGAKPTNLSMKDAMPVETAGKIIVRSVAERRREEIFTVAGKVGEYINFFSPATVEKLILKRWEKEQLQNKEQ